MLVTLRHLTPTTLIHKHRQQLEILTLFLKMGKLKLRKPRNLPTVTQPASRRARIKSKYVRTQSPTVQDGLKARGRAQVAPRSRWVQLDELDSRPRGWSPLRSGAGGVT